MRLYSMSCVGLLAISCIAGCGAPGENGPEPTAEVEIALTTVPTGVQCVQLSATVENVAVPTMSFPVTAGTSSATLNAGMLPAGTAVITGSAFNVACTDITAGVSPTWVADSGTTELKAGVVSRVELTFRKVNPLTVSANFLDNVSQIAAGPFSSYALMSGGTVKQWGQGPISRLFAPTSVPSLTNVAQVTAGGYSGTAFACARKTDGTVWCWGTNSFGALGTGVAIGATVSTPVQISLPGGALDIAAGTGHVCAVVSEPSLAQPTTIRTWCWGWNALGQLGNGTQSNSPAPVVVNLLRTPARVYAGDLHTCVVSALGTISCWGVNDDGQLGDGTTTLRLTPFNVTAPGLGATVDMALGSAHTCALRADGQLRCWGGNGSGQIGDGTYTRALVPYNALNSVSQVVAGSLYTCALEYGIVYCWGTGAAGQLGDGAGTARNYPGQVSLGAVNAIRAHLGDHTCAELRDLTTWCWGSNAYGQIGDGTLLNAAKPTQVKLQ